MRISSLPLDLRDYAPAERRPTEFGFGFDHAMEAFADALTSTRGDRAAVPTTLNDALVIADIVAAASLGGYVVRKTVSGVGRRLARRAAARSAQRAAATTADTVGAEVDEFIDLADNLPGSQAARSVAPDNVFRGDANLTSQLNSKGIPKSLLNEAGDLVPANPSGVYKGRQVSVGEHILGGFRRGAKSNSPFTSFTPHGQIAGGYGGQTVTIDLNALRRAVSAGEVKGVQILDQAAVQQAIRNDPLLSDHWKNLASRWAARDQEVLIRGVIPKRFIKID